MTAGARGPGAQTSLEDYSSTAGRRSELKSPVARGAGDVKMSGKPAGL